MSDPIQNFEFILKKNSKKRPLGLYSDNKQQNKLIYKPQDVILSVSKQLNAIQVADSVGMNKNVCKDLQKYKNPNFISVNNLPVYDEVPKITTKFDTQCVSDTQLMNIIEDAEIIDVHRGMTQEFETTFVHHTEKHSLEDDEQSSENVGKEGTEKKHEPAVFSEKVIKNEETQNNKEYIEYKKKSITVNRIELNIESENSISLISPIMCGNNIIETGNSFNCEASNNDENTQIEENIQVIHDCVEIEDDNDIDKSIERPVSPIFMHKNMKTNSKTPSPLIFNLERFEQFEKIAIPIIESNDLKTAKQVIDSQILDKELCFQIDEDVQLNHGESPVLQSKRETQELKTHIVKDPNLDTDLEFIELDKATSDDLINKIMNDGSKSNSKRKAESEILKDEILFSSDEEDNYKIHKSYQDLPFTCALETSFYEQSDVLDKTMFVGFQTASNKSIQIFTESFAHAKSILSDAITVTDLVNNCDSSVKNKTEVDETHAKKYFGNEETEFSLAQKDSMLPLECNTNEMTHNIEAKTRSFEGFRTANNKEIKLSQKALARTKKVFQDIDLSDNFDTQIEDKNIERQVEIPVVSKTQHVEVNKNLVDDEIQNIDDEIIQEFENIEMSLPENKEPDKHIGNNEFIASSNKNTHISETGKINDVIKDIDFDEDLIEVNIEETKMKENSLPLIIEGPNYIDIHLGGFKTASNKNIIISKEALVKTKTIFQDISTTECPNKTDKAFDKNYSNCIDIQQPSTSRAEFVGFKTANNKNIKISEQALAKVTNIFKDIDNTGLPKENIKEKQTYMNEEKLSFVGFKTANNKDIKISKDALAKTKNMFEGIDSSDFKLPMKRNTDSPKLKIYPEISESDENFNQPSTSKVSFVGFKTASNKNVKISEAALAKTKYIFKDIDSVDVTFPEKDKNIDDEKIIDDVRPIDATAVTAPAQPSFKGFQTANNKEIKISEKALAKTKDIFRDLDSDNYMYPEKLNKNSRERIEDNDLISHAAEMIHLNMPSTSTTSFAGFKTAKNKNINISKEAPAKTKNIFKNIDATDFNLPDKVDSGLKIIKPVEESVKTSNQNKNIETEDFNPPSTSKANFIGFKTASNRKIAISKESSAKTKNIFKDIDKTEFVLTENPIKDIQTAENITKKDSVSTFRYEIIDLNQPTTSKSSYVSFKTANNKKINISEEYLAKSKKLFNNIDASDFTFKSKSEKENINGAKERKSPYPDLNNSEAKTFKTESGFKTANNKVINISEIALARSKNLLQDLGSIVFQSKKQKKKDYPDIEKDDLKSKINSDEDLDNLETAVPKFQGFQTASNKTVKVSAEALVKSKKLFEDIDVSQNLNIERKEIKTHNILEADKDYLHDYKIINNHIEDKNGDDLSGNGKASPVFKGFQTANKKPIKVSEEALARSRKQFEDIETIKDDPEPEFHGFKTGNDEEVELSQKTLADTKKLFEDVIKRSSFQGFQTASDKKVAISDEALAKTRKVFQNLDKDEHLLINNEKKNSVKFGFKTGSNREVLVSEEALARSKRRHSQIDNSNENIKSSKKDKATEHSISNIVDTQVLNNFEVSLHTEDFHDTPIKSKRSGSPILSCPRAKRRKKFETPYSQKLPTKVKKKEVLQTTNDTNKIPFTEDYKKNKKYTLKDLAELTKSNTIKFDPYILNFTYDNLLKFEFNHKRNELLNDNLTVLSLKQLFLNSVNNKLIPTGWLDNHLKLILWKLISYEVKFKILTATVKNVIDQLKYRYDKELYNAQRPALRKILEKDDVASKTLVLCVAGIYVDGVNVVSATTTNNLELLLTDGWYCIKATIDKMLAQLVCQGKIVVGSKIVTNGAELVNCEQGMSPWEDTSAVRLKISGNSTRRARWDARLGYHAGAILSELSSVKLEGGKVSKLRVFVTRVYPALYVEKFEDGSTVTRSERLEHLHQMKSETERQAIMEKIYEDVEKEFSDEESQDSEGVTASIGKRTCLDSGSQIAKHLKKSKDPAEFRACLTSSQNRLLESHTVKHREHLLQNIQQKIRQKIENAGVCVNRSVVTLLKIRVAGVKGSGEVTKGMMSIWKPPEAVLEIIKEGAWIDIMNVVPTAIRYSEIQISAGRQSVFSASKSKEPENIKKYTNLLKRICYTIKDLSHNPLMATDYNEIDTVGFIFVIDPSIKEFDSTKQPFQNVFLADADKNMICINFWGGLKKFGYENVLDTGQIVYCANLQKRAGNTRKSIPQYRVTEFSYFTKMPKNENARILVDDLSKKFLCLDRRKFSEDCVVLKNNYAVIKLNSENISPYRFNNNDFNISKNKMFIDSPLARPNRKDDNFNLTGLDFESTFKQTDTQNMSEEVLQRKRKVNEKIAKLKMYGEPPPLSTIHIINKSKNASSSYKSPLNSSSKMLSEKSRRGNDMSKSDSSVNVASVKETPDKCQNSDIICSPVLMNKTFVKYVNPVKINFDVKDNNDSNFDHFAEEFDGSPPLSLD